MHHMGDTTRIIVVTSGKGGVGKTTSSASIATGLAMLGHKTVVIDFDVGLRNLDLVMGCERRVVFDATDVISGRVTVQRALIQDKRLSSLFILPTSQTKDKDVLDKQAIGDLLSTLCQQQFEYIICDSPAGIEKGASMASYYANFAILVVNPEISSVRDSDRMMGLLTSCSKMAEEHLHLPVQLLITRYHPNSVRKGLMLHANDMLNILMIPLLGIIPETKSVLSASNLGTPVIWNQKSKASKAYQDVCARIVANTPINVEDCLKQLPRRSFWRLWRHHDQ
jgi:septum site-determining protein MinD